MLRSASSRPKIGVAMAGRPCVSAPAGAQGGLRIVREDRVLELAERGPEAELDELGAGPAVRGERIGVPAGPVKSEHVLRAK